MKEVNQELEGNKWVKEQRASGQWYWFWIPEISYDEACDERSYGDPHLDSGEGNAPREFKHHEFGMDVRNLTRGQLNESYAELKAHAERLAEAAKQVERDWNITRRKYLASSMAKLREALAAWEGAQK